MYNMELPIKDQTIGQFQDKFQDKFQEIKCQQNKPSQSACFNKNCTKYAFVCQDDSCQCRKQHSLCLIIQTKTVIKNLLSKIISIKPLQKYVQERVDNCIDEISKQKDQLITEMSKKKQFLGLLSGEKQFLKSMKEGQVYNITGCNIWNNSLQSDKVHPLLQKLPELMNEIDKGFKKLMKSVQETFAQFRRLIAQYMQTSQSQTLFQQKIVLYKQGFSKSAKSYIIGSQQESLALTSFFLPKRIKNIELLYRGSENEFSAVNFHQRCQKQPHTLILCHTQFDKIIGGYTPLVWQNSIHGKQQKDLSGQSFMFSLSNKDKFTYINKNNRAIYSQTSYGPVFGTGNDLFICDKANINNGSYANFNHAYQNLSYLNANKVNDYQKFCGNPLQSSFKLRQWEVWKINFTQQAQQKEQVKTQKLQSVKQ